MKTELSNTVVVDEYLEAVNEYNERNKKVDGLWEEFEEEDFDS